MTEIRFYRATGKYGFLSSLYRRPITFENRVFGCAEAAYQFGKPKDVAVAEWIVSAPKPHLMAIAAHGLFVFDVQPNWKVIKVPRMRSVIDAKFDQHTDLAKLLLDTDDAELIEESNMDAFWGIGKRGNGQNMLGKLLMEKRTRLAAALAAVSQCGEVIHE